MWRKSEDKSNSSPVASPSPDPGAQHPGAETTSGSSAAPATVNRGIKITGEISGHGDFFIDGVFEGKVHLSDGTFTVGPNATVTAEIEAREIIVRGEVIGTLKARERVHISNTGRLTGDMDTRGIMIEDGAILHSKVAVPHAAPRAAAPPTAQEVLVPQAASPEAALPAVPASEGEAPEVLPDADPGASPEAFAENDQPSLPRRAKRAAASAAPPSSKES